RPAKVSASRSRETKDLLPQLQSSSPSGIRQLDVSANRAPVHPRHCAGSRSPPRPRAPPQNLLARAPRSVAPRRSKEVHQRELNGSRSSRRVGSAKEWRAPHANDAGDVGVVENIESIHAEFQ